MLAGKGRRWRKGRALFVFRQDSGIIAWRSDLQVLYEAHLALAACGESWFPCKTPDSMWQGLFAVAGVIVHSCHSSLGYLLQSTLTLAPSSFNTRSPASPRLDICSWGRTEPTGAFPRGFVPTRSPPVPPTTPTKPSEEGTEPQGTLYGLMFWCPTCYANRISFLLQKSIHGRRSSLHSIFNFRAQPENSLPQCQLIPFCKPAMLSHWLR